MNDEATIQRAARALLDAAPGSRVILFGSYARGDARPDSDLDFMVIKPGVESIHAEMNRLTNLLWRMGIYADVLVMSEAHFDKWSQAPGTVYYRAAREGKVFRDSS